MLPIQLNNYSIRARLWAMLTITIICILMILGGALYRAYHNVEQVRELMVRQQTSTALSLIAHYYQLETSGELTQAQAQAQAKQAVKQMRYREVEYFWINDLYPRMIMHPIQPQLEGQDLTQYYDPTGLALFVEFVKVAKASRDGGYVPYLWPKVGSENPVPKTSYVRLFEPWGWIVGTGVYTDEVWSEFLQQSKDLVLVAGLLIVLMLAINLLVVRSIRQPLQRFTQAMFNISQGEGDLTQRLSEQGKDELAEIARSFNYFIEHIYRVVKETQNIVQAMQRLTSQVVTTCEQTAQLTRGQLQETDLSAAASHEMSLTISEVAESAEKAADSARRADNSAQQGLQIIQQAQRQIVELREHIVDSSHSIEELNTQTDKIDRVLTVIQEIAEQTNLLALNAAIEAARAGDAGRGFAVVADEVRNLASRSQRSTQEIQTIISELQAKAQSAVTVMKENVKDSELTEQHAAQAMTAIQDITQAASDIMEMNLSIASAVEEQSAAANEVSQNVVKIVDAANQVVVNMDDTTQSVVQLQTNTTTLRDLVERFKI